MKGGQNRKTPEQLKRDGTRRPDRHGHEADDVDFEGGMPHCPPSLTDEGRKVWNRVVKDLKAAGQLRKAYEAVIAAYASLYAEFLTDPSDFPATKYTQLRLLIAELGLSPVSRSRLSGNDGKGNKPGDFDGF